MGLLKIAPTCEVVLFVRLLDIESPVLVSLGSGVCFRLTLILRWLQKEVQLYVV